MLADHFALLLPLLTVADAPIRCRVTVTVTGNGVTGRGEDDTEVFDQILAQRCRDFAVVYSATAFDLTSNLVGDHSP